MNIFPDDANLRKVGMDIHRNQLLLAFDFPQAAERNYSEQIEELIEQSGWDVRIRPQVNQQALSIALDNLLPEGARISKGPSYFMDKREIQAELADIDSDAIEQLKKDFLQMTDFKLIVTERKEVQVGEITAVASGEKLEINQAYAVVRQTLEPLGMYKVGLKQGQLVLSFISPQLADRYIETITELAKTTGYTLTVHPHPNQQKILEVMRKLANNAGWNISKGPSIFIDRAAVAVSVAGEIEEKVAAQLAEDLEQQTGYTLEFN
jgi:hypothetical protein